MGLTPPEGDRETEVSTLSPNWVTTRLDFLANWARANSLWPMPFGTACCAIEFMAAAASRFDLARFGMERMSFSPRQADVLICAGRLPFKLAPVIRALKESGTLRCLVCSTGQHRAMADQVREFFGLRVDFRPRFGLSATGAVTRSWES